MEEYIELLKSAPFFRIQRIEQHEIIGLIDFQAKPGSKKTFIKTKDKQLIISVSEKPIDGEANEAFVSALANAFSLTMREVQIIRGLKGKSKTAQLTIGESKSRPWKKRIEDLRGLLCQLQD